MAGGLVEFGRRLPLPRLDPVGVGERVDGRVLARALGKRLGEAVIGLQDLDPVAGFWRWTKHG